MKLISTMNVSSNFSIPNYLNQKGYSPNFDYIRYTYMDDLPLPLYVLFVIDDRYVLYIIDSVLNIYQSTGKYLADDIKQHFEK